MTNEMMIGISAFVMGMCGFVFAIVSHNRMNKRINMLDQMTGKELSFISERVNAELYDFHYRFSSIDAELNAIQGKLVDKKKVGKK